MEVRYLDFVAIIIALDCYRAIFSLSPYNEIIHILFVKIIFIILAMKEL